MSAVIRRAMPDDAKAMSAIAQAAFGEALEPDPVRLAKVLSQGLNFVALSRGRVVGFVGNFLTRSSSGRLRFELDLLAVAADARGAGIGAALVAASVEAAKTAETDEIRALVASSNQTMQRLCQAGGFERDQTSRALYVLDAPKGLGAGADVSSALLKDARLTPVYTLTYSGIWLEGEISPGAIDEARERAFADGMSRIGAVIPQADSRLAALLLANGFEKVGDFDWWSIRL